jgi:hypothetical protein
MSLMASFVEEDCRAIFVALGDAVGVAAYDYV